MDKNIITLIILCAVFAIMLILVICSFTGKKNKGKNSKKNSKILRNTIQNDILVFEGITEEGIVCNKKEFSKLYLLPDSNFAIEPEFKQEAICQNYVSFVNAFPDNTDVSIVIVNKKNTMENLTESYHIPILNAETADYARDYNGIIDAKIKEGNNDIQRDKYLLVTIHARTLNDARLIFNTTDITLDDKIKAINRVGIQQMDAIARLQVMRDITRGESNLPLSEEFKKYFDTYSTDGKVLNTLSFAKLKKAGMSVKDMIAPDAFVKENGYIRLGENRICKSFTFPDLPQSLDTSLLTRITDLPYEGVTVVQLRTTPRKTALRNVKMMNVSIKADVIKASRTAYKNGYDPSLMNEDLQIARAESAQIREDVVVKGKKLFFATICSTFFAKDEAELKIIHDLFRSKCEDFSISVNSLYGQQVEGYQTALAFGSSKIIGDRMITSDDARALFPFYIQELSDRRGHFYGTNALSRNMIMYDRKRSPNANGMIFGQSGSGKSFIAKGEITANILDGNDDIIILDPENEYEALGKAFKAVNIALDETADYYINPCDMVMEWDEKINPLNEKKDYFVGLVESILGGGRSCNSYEVAVIHRVVGRMYEPYIREMTVRFERGDTRTIDTSISPTLVDFYNILSSDDSLEARKLSMAVEPYCVGAYNLFAHKTNIQTQNRFLIFNLLKLPDKMREMAMKVCLSYIWTKVVANRERNKILKQNKSIWIYMDEFHLFFNTESSINTVKAYYKRVRKYAGVMTGITQDVSDLLRSSQGQAMFDNSGFFIFLSQSPNGRIQLQNLYDWSDSQVDYLNEKGSGIGLIYNNKTLIPFNYRIPTTSKLYELYSTNPNDASK